MFTPDPYDVAANSLRQRGIYANHQWPGNLFVDLEDGSRWGFTAHLNRADSLIEVYYYPPDQSREDYPEPLGEQDPIPLRDEDGCLDGERLAAEIAARILKFYAPLP